MVIFLKNLFCDCDDSAGWARCEQEIHWGDEKAWCMRWKGLVGLKVWKNGIPEGAQDPDTFHPNAPCLVGSAMAVRNERAVMSERKSETQWSALSRRNGGEAQVMKCSDRESELK